MKAKPEEKKPIQLFPNETQNESKISIEETGHGLLEVSLLVNDKAEAKAINEGSKVMTHACKKLV